MTTGIRNAPATRETTHAYRPDGGGKDRPLIVTLGPGDTITIRPKGTQREVVVMIDAVYRDAIRASAAIPQRRK